VIFEVLPGCGVRGASALALDFMWALSRYEARPANVSQGCRPDAKNLPDGKSDRTIMNEVVGRHELDSREAQFGFFFFSYSLPQEGDGDGNSSMRCRMLVRGEAIRGNGPAERS